jgi:undecaprenyl-diphosphatase
MTIIQAIILGLVQGLTEFLPISSSAHLGIIPAIFKWQEQSIGFDIYLHAASLIALVLFFKKDIRGLLGAIIGKKSEFSSANSRKFGLAIFISLLPLIPAYLLLHNFIDSIQTFSILTPYLLIIFAIVLIIADRVGEKGKLNIFEVSKLKAILIGIAQCIAFFSGVSRSGITISTGLFLGLKIEEAKKYTFLLAIPTIAGGFLMELISTKSLVFSIPLLAGFIAAFLSSYLALILLFKYGSKLKLSYYGYYRIILGIILLIFLF